MDCVAVDLADVQVVPDLGYLFPDDPVGDAPSSFRGLGMVVRQGLPERAFKESDDAARGLGGASVVLAMVCAEQTTSAFVCGENFKPPSSDARPETQDASVRIPDAVKLEEAGQASDRACYSERGLGYGIIPCLYRQSARRC